MEHKSILPHILSPFIFFLKKTSSPKVLHIPSLYFGSFCKQTSIIPRNVCSLSSAHREFPDGVFFCANNFPWDSVAMTTHQRSAVSCHP
jgi:hypothetical protein